MSNVLSRLIQLTEEKKKIMLIILDKTVEQQVELLNDNIDQVNEITDSKQVQINIIDNIDAEFENEYKCFERINNDKALDSEEKKYYEQLKIIRSEIVQIIEKINLIECENKTNLLKKMNVVKQNIHQVMTGKKGFNAYFQSSAPNSIYIDHKN